MAWMNIWNRFWHRTWSHLHYLLSWMEMRRWKLMNLKWRLNMWRVYQYSWLIWFVDNPWAFVLWHHSIWHRRSEIEFIDWLIGSNTCLRCTYSDIFFTRCLMVILILFLFNFIENSFPFIFLWAWLGSILFLTLRQDFIWAIFIINSFSIIENTFHQIVESIWVFRLLYVFGNAYGTLDTFGRTFNPFLWIAHSRIIKLFFCVPALACIGEYIEDKIIHFEYN